MIEGFKVIETKEDDVWIDYIYSFKFTDYTYYSQYSVSKDNIRIVSLNAYFEKPEFKVEKALYFCEEMKNEMEKFILNQKEIRIRHLFKPYHIY